MSIQGGDIVSNLRLLGRRHLEGFEIGREKMMLKRFLGRREKRRKVEVALAKIKADVGLPEEGLSLPQDAWGVDSGLRCLPRLARSRLAPR